MTKTAIRRLDSQEINKMEKYRSRDLGSEDRKKRGKRNTKGDRQMQKSLLRKGRERRVIGVCTFVQATAASLCSSPSPWGDGDARQGRKGETMSLGQWRRASLLEGQAECRSRARRVEMLSTEA